MRWYGLAKKLMKVPKCQNVSKSMIRPSKTPYILYSDSEGQIFEDPSLECSGKTGQHVLRLQPDDFIPLPDGSDFFMLPGRKGLGYNRKTKSFEVCQKGLAVAAFLAPAYTQKYLPPWVVEPKAPVLPLYAYTAIGWMDNRFWVPAIRVDSDIRQDCSQFNQKVVAKNAKAFCKANPENRLLKHIAHCATVYYCPAARNYFLNRWEMPLPTSPACNSRCLGCISWQPKASNIRSTQDRISFVPTPQEIAELAVGHLESAPNPIVSFGQGCEGEPLHVYETLAEAIRLIRKQTQKGIVNLNTNASNPVAIEMLSKAGLDSMRVSMNSLREEYYNAYYNPVNYKFEDVHESISVCKKHNKWVSINYLTFPGFTDMPEEFAAMEKLIQSGLINMIQWRNFNIDPDMYLTAINDNSQEKPMGIDTIIHTIKSKYPNILHGYFNPGKELIHI